MNELQTFAFYDIANISVVFHTPNNPMPGAFSVIVCTRHGKLKYGLELPGTPHRDTMV